MRTAEPFPCEPIACLYQSPQMRCDLALARMLPVVLAEKVRRCDGPSNTSPRCVRSSDQVTANVCCQPIYDCNVCYQLLLEASQIKRQTPTHLIE